MKKLLFVVLAIVLVSSMLVIGCTGGPKEVIELKLAHAYAPWVDEEGAIGLGQGIGNWAQKIEAETNGQVKITIYPAGALLKNPDIYSGTVGGVCDIGYWDPIFDPSRFQATLVFNNYGLDWPESSETKFKIIDEMVDTFPELQAEIEEVKMLYYDDVPGGTLHFRDRIEVRVPADMKGLKVQASGNMALLCEQWEAVPVEVDIFDAYIAMERGTVEVCGFPWGGMRAFRLHEVTKAHTDVVTGRPIACMLMNLDRWNSLPNNVKKVFEDNNMWGALELTQQMNAEGVEGKQWAVDDGQLFTEITPEERALWAQSMLPVQDSWVKLAEDMGLPGRELLDELKALIAKYK